MAESVADVCLPAVSFQPAKTNQLARSELHVHSQQHQHLLNNYIAFLTQQTVALLDMCRNQAVSASFTVLTVCFSWHNSVLHAAVAPHRFWQAARCCTWQHPCRRGGLLPISHSAATLEAGLRLHNTAPPMLAQPASNALHAHLWSSCWSAARADRHKANAM